MAKVKLLQKHDGHKRGSIIDVKSTEVPYMLGMGIAQKYSGKAEAKPATLQPEAPKGEVKPAITK